MFVIPNKTYYVKRYGTNSYLNIYGSSYTGDKQPVKLWSKVENDPMQKWQFDNDPYTGAFLCTMCDLSRAINLYSTTTPNCTIWKKSGNEQDGQVRIRIAAEGGFYIYLVKRNLYLTAVGTANGTQVTWMAKMEGNATQRWEFEPESSTPPTVPSVPDAIKDQTLYVKNYNTGYNLNVYGSDTVVNTRNVNVYSKVNCLAQKWIARQTSAGPKLFTSINESFALNIDASTSNCTMYTALNNDADSVLEFIPYTDSQTSLSDRVYRIKMLNHNKYLTAERIGNEANVYWTSNINEYTLWQFMSESQMFPPAPPIPNEIKDKEFFLKAGNSECYLNVHGSDTVADGRNVNIFDKKDCLAQRWIAKQTAGGPKLFSKINQAFAINIYTERNNDCVMYTAEGNDNDSVLLFESVGVNQYKIKMYNHDKYLAVDGEAVSGANVVWADGSYAATVWTFETESEAFPPADPTPEEIKNKEFYLRAGNSKFYLNVHGTDTIAVGRNVNVYSKDDCKAQIWIAKQTARGPKLFSKINQAFALNIYEERNNDCVMYTAENNDHDSVLQFEYVDKRKYKIKMHNHNKYLTVEGDMVSGANVFWGDSFDKAIVWTFETESEVFPSAPTAPEEIKDKTFFVYTVSNDNEEETSFYLNIHGSDTVANTRNVDIFSLENCLAQRWIAKNTPKGPKLFTRIDESFAINIYKDDCTMYTADGNDMDSVLEFIKIDSMKYKIKMFYHDKYLAVSGNPSVGSDVIWVDNINSAAVWNFISENDLELPEGGIAKMFTADSSLVTTVIPAHTNNFTPNRKANNSSIAEICIHHAAGNITVENLGAIWQNPDRAGSSHYGVNGTKIGQYVKESDIAWTNGHWESNKRSVTIETANCSGSPNWLVSDETLNSLIKLVADIARRNNLGKLVVGKNLTYHSMYSATLCPGPYLFSKMEYIANSANKLNKYIESVARNLIGEVHYIKEINTNKYLNISNNLSSLKNINVELAYATKYQKWNVSAIDNGLTLLSYADKKALIKVGNNNNCEIDFNPNQENAPSFEFIPYTEDGYDYSDKVFRIKLKGTSLYMSLDLDNKNVIWTNSEVKSSLWQFKSPNETLTEIKENTIKKRLELICDTFKIDKNFINEVIKFGESNISIPEIDAGLVTIKPEITVSTELINLDDYNIGLSINFMDLDDPEITMEEDSWGISNTVNSFDISDIDDFKKAILNTSIIFNGGDIAFKTSIIDAYNGKFELVSNINLTPFNPEVKANISVTLKIDVNLKPEAEFMFNEMANITAHALLTTQVSFVAIILCYMDFKVDSTTIIALFLCLALLAGGVLVIA